MSPEQQLLLVAIPLVAGIGACLGIVIGLRIPIRWVDAVMRRLDGDATQPLPPRRY